MNSMDKVSNEVRVKDEPICYSQSISETREASLRNNQSNKTRSSDKQSFKQEKHSRDAISSDDQPNKRKRQSMKVKEEPIDSETQKPKSHIESRSEKVEVKVEEKFSAEEEFANKTSIAFLNEEATLEATTADNQA